MSRKPSWMTLVVEERGGITRGFQIHMCTRAGRDAGCLKLTKSSKEIQVNVKLVRTGQIVDIFQGKAWGRGYLLYGPTGTGKSSLIGAIDNFLKLDIYDLQLLNVGNDSNIRELWLSTPNQSINSCD
ncbi:hypothetical protein RJ640_011168 [Escallonia rubra]|uniref:ATPase AAA-type core domain-containing protein n=1 Tax=Escallonia rubra TaxID=112253 RepID=A0AA88UM48_9ASTE|nr:hypothetical protein RJ640_011168 [Escallonia rubra]